MAKFIPEKLPMRASRRMNSGIYSTADVIRTKMAKTLIDRTHKDEDLEF